MRRKEWGLGTELRTPRDGRYSARCSRDTTSVDVVVLPASRSVGEVRVVLATYVH